MNSKQVFASVALFLGLNGAVVAATQITQGVIRFHGNIVEASCTPSASVGGSAQGNRLDLSSCPSLARGNDIRVNAVGPTSKVTSLNQSPVNVKLLTESGDGGRYFNQQYALVDNAGKPIRSGTYLITLTSP